MNLRWRFLVIALNVDYQSENQMKCKGKQVVTQLNCLRYCTHKRLVFLSGRFLVLLNHRRHLENQAYTNKFLNFNRFFFC